ncbi:MAG: 6-phosphogluconolactonase [Hyphomonadaceae bacterium]
MTIETFTFIDRKRLFAQLGADMTDHIAAALKKRRKASLALAGGTTPGPLYEHLSHQPLKWEKVSVTVTDERWVHPDDPGSNAFLVRDMLLNRRAAEASFIPMKTNHARPTAGAATAEKRIAPIMPFDICLIGMGSDGHIASLIPGAEGFEAAADPDAARMVAGVHAEGAAGSPDRMTLTMAGILNSRLIVLLFMGQEKMTTFELAIAGEGVSPVRTLAVQKKVPVHAYWAP